MVKHTQTIRNLLPTHCLSTSDHFVGLALKELKFYFDMAVTSALFLAYNI